MTYYVSSETLNPTHSLTHSLHGPADANLHCWRNNAGKHSSCVLFYLHDICNWCQTNSINILKAQGSITRDTILLVTE